MFCGEIVAPHEQTTEGKCLQHVWVEDVDVFCALYFSVYFRMLGLLICLWHFLQWKRFFSQGGKQTLQRGFGICVSHFGISQGRSCLDSKCRYQVDVQPTAVPPVVSLRLYTTG